MDDNNVMFEEKNTYNYSEYMENQEDNLCRKCGQFYIDRSENENSILCSKCREEQLH